MTNVLPTTTVYPLGFGFLYTQCAAVTIQSGLISDPPQICLPRTRRETCHGQEWGLASWPLITREKEGRTPHPIIQGKCDECYYRCISMFILTDPDVTRKEGRGGKDMKIGIFLSSTTHPCFFPCRYVIDFAWLFRGKHTDSFKESGYLGIVNNDDWF